MKQNGFNSPQGAGYNQQPGYPQGYPGPNGYPSYQAPQGYPAQTGAQPAQGYQAQQGYPGGQPVQGYPLQQAQQGYQAPQAQQGYQTPQVTGSQPAAGAYPNGYTAPGTQGTVYKNPYAAQGYPAAGGYQANAAYSQQMPGYQPPASGTQQGYPFPGNQPPAGSYIPQTPYSQGYTSPGYQAPSGYNQGYSAYGQMGRAQQPPMNQVPETTGQVPLNGGGYVPQPVPVRRRPFEVTDADLLILSAILLILFALGLFVGSLGVLKWVFLALAAGSIALLWIKPLVANNKRLCYTVVFGLLILVTVITAVIPSRTAPTTVNTQTETDSTNITPVNRTQGNSQANEPAQEPTATAAVASTPDPGNDQVVLNRLETFFYYWNANRQEDMLSLCLPTWQSKADNPRTALFAVIANRTPLDYSVEGIGGTPNDTSRTVTVRSQMDRNNGKPPILYRLSVIMVRESDDQWYVDPQSLQTYEAVETTDPSVTPTPGPTDTPAIYANTVLYYNPSGGEYYHLDQNCKRINERYLPLQGHFTYSELGKDPYNKLKPCAICGAPSLGQ